MATFIGQLIFDGASAFKTTEEEVEKLKKTGVIHHTLSYFEPTSFFYQDCCQNLEPLGMSRFSAMLKLTAGIKALAVWVIGTTGFSVIMFQIEVGDQSTSISNNWAIVLIVTLLTALISDVLGRAEEFNCENFHERTQDDYQVMRNGPVIMDQSVGEFNEYYSEKFAANLKNYYTRRNKRSCYLRALTCICSALLCCKTKPKVYNEGTRKVYGRMQANLLEGNNQPCNPMEYGVTIGAVISIGISIWYGFKILNIIAVKTGAPPVTEGEYAWTVIQSMLLGWAQAFPTIILFYYLKRNCIKPKGVSLLNSDNDPLADSSIGGNQNNYGSVE